MTKQASMCPSIGVAVWMYMYASCLPSHNYTNPFRIVYHFFLFLFLSIFLSSSMCFHFLILMSCVLLHLSHLSCTLHVPIVFVHLIACTYLFKKCSSCHWKSWKRKTFILVPNKRGEKEEETKIKKKTNSKNTKSQRQADHHIIHTAHTSQHHTMVQYCESTTFFCLCRSLPCLRNQFND